MSCLLEHLNFLYALFGVFTLKYGRGNVVSDRTYFYGRYTINLFVALLQTQI